MAYPAIEHMARNRMRITQSDMVYSPKGFLGDVIVARTGSVLVLGGLCGQRIPHRPKRFKLLLVTLRLFAICEILAAMLSFLSRSPANPFPACTLLSKFFNTSVDVSMFFIATSMLGRFDAIRSFRLSLNWLIRSEKAARLVLAWEI